MTLLTSSLLLFSLLTSRLEAIPVLEKSPAHPAHSKPRMQKTTAALARQKLIAAY